MHSNMDARTVIDTDISRSYVAFKPALRTGQWWEWRSSCRIVFHVRKRLHACGRIDRGDGRPLTRTIAVRISNAQTWWTSSTVASWVRLLRDFPFVATRRSYGRPSRAWPKSNHALRCARPRTGNRKCSKWWLQRMVDEKLIRCLF